MKNEKLFLKVYHILIEQLGPQGWWPILDIQTKQAVYNPDFSIKTKNSSEQLEIILGAILTQNTNWGNVTKAIINLKQNHLIDTQNLNKINLEDLANLIKPSGYFNQKAKKIKAYIQSDIQPNRENLLSIWGIGEETADSILLYAYNQPYFVIDAYTKRIFSRLNPQLKLQKYSDWQALFINSLPKDFYLFNEYHALLVNIGKNFCKKKPLCGYCPLKSICQY